MTVGPAGTLSHGVERRRVLGLAPDDPAPGGGLALERLGLVRTPAVAKERGERVQHLEADVREVGLDGDRQRLAEELLRLLVAGLGGAHEPERHPGRRARALVLRPDGL